MIGKALDFSASRITGFADLTRITRRLRTGRLCKGGFQVAENARLGESGYGFQAPRLHGLLI